MLTPGEVLSVELFDFDADPRDEIITVQKTGCGKAGKRTRSRQFFNFDGGSSIHGGN